MARVLHLWRGGDPSLARSVITQQLAAGDAVMIGLLGDSGSEGWPAGVTIHPFGHHSDYGALVDLLFAADHVITW